MTLNSNNAVLYQNTSILLSISRLTVVFLEKISRRMQLPSVVATPMKDLLQRIAAMTFVLKMLMRSNEPYLLKEALREYETLSVARSSVIDRPSVLVYSSC